MKALSDHFIFIYTFLKKKKILLRESAQFIVLAREITPVREVLLSIRREDDPESDE